MGKYIPVEETQIEKHRKERIGQKKKNNQGIEMTIIEYINNANLTVEFSDGYKKKSTYGQYKEGSINNPNYPKHRPMKLKEERMSKIIINNEGYPMRIAEYNKAKDVVVEFLDDYHAKVHTNYCFFESGGVRNPNRIGTIGERVGNESPTIENKKETKEFKTWRAIINRVKGMTEHSRRFYDGVKISDDWLYYTNFYNWTHNQENYERWKNNTDGIWCIDKDILSDPSNKIYSPETCCLVPDYVNSVIVRQGQKDRKYELPLGIQYYPYGEGKYFYTDKNSRPKKNYYYNSIEEAINGYKEYRIRRIKETADYAYNKGDITKRCYDGLLKYDPFADEKLETK